MAVLFGHLDAGSCPVADHHGGGRIRVVPGLAQSQDQQGFRGLDFHGPGKHLYPIDFLDPRHVEDSGAVDPVGEDDPFAVPVESAVVGPAPGQGAGLLSLANIIEAASFISPGRATLSGEEIGRPNPVTGPAQAIAVGIEHDRFVGHGTGHPHHFRVKEHSACGSSLAQSYGDRLEDGAIGHLDVTPHVNGACKDTAQF